MPNFGKDYFLIQSKTGSSRRFYIVQLTASGEKPIPLIVARLWVQPAKQCGGWTIMEVAAQRGFGPSIYDAAMELLYPEGLLPDLTSVSSAAQKVWDYFYTKRPDVQQSPKAPSCKQWGKEPLDTVYLKKPGVYKRSVLTPEEFNRQPVVIKHFGKQPEYGDPAVDLWDGTPSVPGGFE